MSRYVYDAGGRTHEAVVEPTGEPHAAGGPGPLAVRIGGGEARVVEPMRVRAAGAAGAELCLSIDGRLVRGAVARDADGTVLVGLAGRVYRLSRPKPSGTRGKGGDDHALETPMPATVIAVHVAVGQAVKKGDLLLTLEAMKMTRELRAPYAACVEELHCAQGGLAQPGTPLIRLVRTEVGATGEGA